MYAAKLSTTSAAASSAPNAILWWWLAAAVLILLLAIGLGLAINGRLDGILIDTRGRYSLTQLQVVLWTLTVFSLIAGAFFGRWQHHVSDPLNFTIPSQLWGVLGISVGSTVLSMSMKATNDSMRGPQMAVSIPRKSDREAVADAEIAAADPAAPGVIGKAAAAVQAAEAATDAKAAADSNAALASQTAETAKAAAAKAAEDVKALTVNEPSENGKAAPAGQATEAAPATSAAEGTQTAAVTKVIADDQAATAAPSPVTDLLPATQAALANQAAANDWVAQATNEAKAAKKAQQAAANAAAQATRKATLARAAVADTWKPKFTQIFMQEQGAYADKVVDVTKFQNFLLTVVLIIAYVGAVMSAVHKVKTAQDFTALPGFEGTFLILLAISHGAYITGKAIPQQGEPPHNMDNRPTVVGGTQAG
jgi:hypothetical protein